MTILVRISCDSGMRIPGTNETCVAKGEFERHLNASGGVSMGLQFEGWEEKEGKLYCKTCVELHALRKVLTRVLPDPNQDETVVAENSSAIREVMKNALEGETLQTNAPRRRPPGISFTTFLRRDALGMKVDIKVWNQVVQVCWEGVEDVCELPLDGSHHLIEVPPYVRSDVIELVEQCLAEHRAAVSPHQAYLISDVLGDTRRNVL